MLITWPSLPKDISIQPAYDTSRCEDVAAWLDTNIVINFKKKDMFFVED